MKNIKTVPHSAKRISIIDMMDTKTILRTASEPRPKFPDFITCYKKACIWSILGVISYCCCSYEYF